MLDATLPAPIITWRDWRSFGDTPVRDVWRWFVPHIVGNGYDEIYILVIGLWEIEFERAIISGAVDNVMSRVRRALGR